MDSIEISGFELGVETFTLPSNKCKIKKYGAEDGTVRVNIKKIGDEPLYYSFDGINGLCLTTKYGSVRKKNLLLEMASLDIKDEDLVIQFLEENGFFFPLQNGVASFSLDDCLNILYRIMATTELISELGTVKPNIDRIVHSTLYLLLSDKIELRSEGSEKILFSSPLHESVNVINQSSIAVNTDYDTDEAAEKNTYTVKDTVYPETYELDAEDYDSIISGEDPWHTNPENTDTRYRKLSSVFKTNHNLNRNSRCVIDFLFHYMYEVGVIKNIDYKNGIDYYQAPSADPLNDNLQKALMVVARIVVANEINTVISRSVRPFFNADTLDTTWRATSLHAALLFSLFYMRPGKSVFKRCSNPTCNKYFSVSSTNGRRTYCCKKCRDANNSRRHRLKEKQTPEH